MRLSRDLTNYGSRCDKNEQRRYHPLLLGEGGVRVEDLTRPLFWLRPVRLALGVTLTGRASFY